MARQRNIKKRNTMVFRREERYGRLKVKLNEVKGEEEGRRDKGTLR